MFIDQESLSHFNFSSKSSGWIHNNNLKLNDTINTQYQENNCQPLRTIVASLLLTPFQTQIMEGLAFTHAGLLS